MLRLLFILATTLALCTGCTIPRAVERCVLAIEASPIPPGGRRVRVEVIPFLMPAAYQPAGGWAKAYLTTPTHAEDTLAFYRNALARRGWHETDTAPDWAGRAWPHSRINTWCFTRVRTFGGGKDAWVLTRDLLVLHLQADSPDSPTNIRITVYPLNAWDVPPRTVLNGLWRLQDVLEHHGPPVADLAYFAFLEVATITF